MQIDNATMANTPQLHSLQGLVIRDARVIDVLDGDTLVVAAWFPNLISHDAAPRVSRVTIRVEGIDTPERTSHDENARALARLAHARAIALVLSRLDPHHTPAHDELLSICSQNRTVTRSGVQNLLQRHAALVDVRCGPQDKFGRTLGAILCGRGAEDLGTRLMAMGLAVPYGHTAAAAATTT